MGIDWAMVSGIGAVIAAIAAVVLVVVESRSTRFVSGLDVLMRLEHEYRGEPSILEKRSAAAQGLLAGDVVSELDDVLNFFETVGMLLRKRVLDSDMVWSGFYGSSTGWWFAAAAYITRVRSADPNIWVDYAYLMDEMAKTEKRRSGKNYRGIALSTDKIEYFLRNELPSEIDALAPADPEDITGSEVLSNPDSLSFAKQAKSDGYES